MKARGASQARISGDTTGKRPRRQGLGGRVGCLLAYPAPLRNKAPVCPICDSAHADSDGSRSLQVAENVERAKIQSACDLDVVSHMELFEGRSDLHK